MHQTTRNCGASSADGRLKKLLFTVTVITAFAFGLYSLFLASADAGKGRPSNIAGLQRTATKADTEKIETALGNLTEQNLVFVVLYNEETGFDPEIEVAARRAARDLSDTGITVPVRFVGPGDGDFTKIVEQNGVGRFPAVLAVKKDGGILLVTDGITEKSLLHAYRVVWGKTSSCDDAKSDIY